MLGGASSCSGYVRTPFGNGVSSSSTINNAPDGGFTALPSLHEACKLNTAVFSVAIVAMYVYLNSHTKPVANAFLVFSSSYPRFSKSLFGVTTRRRRLSAHLQTMDTPPVHHVASFGSASQGTPTPPAAWPRRMPTPFPPTPPQPT
jgi:hypothetical protein